MDIKDIRIGEIYEVKDPERTGCVAFSSMGGLKYLEVKEINNGDVLSYWSLDNNYEKIASCVMCVKPGQIELIVGRTYHYSLTFQEIKNKKRNIMQKITPMLKRLLDADGRMLYKAGFLDSEMELTSKGNDALQTLVFDANKVALVKLAKEDIREEKEAK